MFQRNLLQKQIESRGLRLGDGLQIFPFHGKKKFLTLKRYCIDLISEKYRPENLSLSYIELPKSGLNPFHYRLELDEQDEKGRFILKTITGYPYWLNGAVAKEAYIERMDRVFIDDNKINFDPFDLKEKVDREFDHPLLLDQALVSSQLKILIKGETGTGKTYLASRIHEKSGLRGKFVAVNLSSFNPQLIESELFGHKKGSFTGAFRDREGAFEEAENGTLFLDEIDSLPIDLQTKLLAFLDNNSFRKVGETNEKRIKARLVFASGRSLEQLVDLNKFRKDFYYRVKSGVTIELKPLRNDLKKIREACHYFAKKNEITLSEKLILFYESLAWPGNLRELFGHLDKKKILSRSTKLDFDHLDEQLIQKSSDLSLISENEDILPLDQLKGAYVKRALSLFNGNITMTSRKLHVSEKTIKSILLKT